MRHRKFARKQACDNLAIASDPQLSLSMMTNKRQKPRPPRACALACRPAFLYTLIQQSPHQRSEKPAQAADQPPHPASPPLPPATTLRPLPCYSDAAPFAAYGLSMDDLKNFRQPRLFNPRAPHPAILAPYVRGRRRPPRPCRTKASAKPVAAWRSAANGLAGRAPYPGKAISLHQPLHLLPSAADGCLKSALAKKPISL